MKPLATIDQLRFTALVECIDYGHLNAQIIPDDRVGDFVESLGITDTIEKALDNSEQPKELNQSTIFTLLGTGKYWTYVILVVTDGYLMVIETPEPAVMVLLEAIIGFEDNQLTMALQDYYDDGVSIESETPLGRAVLNAFGDTPTILNIPNTVH